MLPHNFYVKQDGLLKRVDLREILVMEADNNLVTLKGLKNKFTIRATLESILDQVQGRGFIQIHRKFAVALSQIATIGPETLMLSSIPDHEYPISPTYRQTLLNQILILEAIKPG